MKKVCFCVQSLFIFLFIIIGLTSCSNNNSEKLIVGKWNVNSILSEDLGYYFIEGEEYDYRPISAYCTFRKDGTCTACFMKSNFAEGTYAIKDGELKITNIEVSTPLLSFFDAKDDGVSDVYLRLNIDKITETNLKVTGVLGIYYIDHESFIYTIKIALEKI